MRVNVAYIVPTNMNYYLIVRSIPFLLAAGVSMLGINDWVSVMLGPDCWDYSPKELGLKNAGERYGVVGGSGQRYGVSVEDLTDPLAQSLRYAVSGVGVHLLFIAIIMIYLGVFATIAPKDKRPPAFMLLLDGLTFANATGLFIPDTAGHPRCLDDSVPFAECAKGLAAFLPVVVLDLIWMLVVLILPSKKEKEKSM